jgi:hypothetical protein
MKTYLMGSNNKATVEINEDGVIKLTSFLTEVAYIKGNTANINGWYSSTTARHINKFLQQNGFPKISKKEMENKVWLIK